MFLWDAEVMLSFFVKTYRKYGIKARGRGCMGKIRYEIISVIKQSNKGNVYLAKVDGYGGPVVIKLLKRGNRKVFEVLQKLECEYFPQIYQLEETEEGLLVAEEYVEGELLSEYLKGQVLTEEQYISIARQLCDGLGKLHQCVPSVIHRDIKPSNIIVNSKGVVKIIDFDSSRQYKEEAESDTRLLGTEKYAAPEQYGFSQTDCRSDIYSLGIVFGSFPQFASEKRNRLWKKMVEKCTLFAPESRYQSVEEILRELGRIEKTGVVNGRKIVGVAGMLLIVCGILLWTIGRQERNSDEPGIPATPVPTPTLSPTPLLSPTPVLTPTPKPTPTRRPTVTPFEVWKPSPTPTATPLPTITPTPTPLPGPTPTLLPLDLGENVVLYSYADVVNVALPKNSPEVRVVENDPPEIVVLKKKIALENAYVQYYFKDRMQKDDLLTYTSYFDEVRESFIGVKMYSYQTGEWMRLSCTEAMEKDGICHIDGRFMDRLPDGFYHQVIQYRLEGENGIREHSTYVYVAESDTFNEPISYIESNQLEYGREKDIVLHSILRNSVDRRIESVQWAWGDELDSSLYTILYGGRAVEYSSYLLEKFMEDGYVEVYLKFSDGTGEAVTIKKVTNQR